MISILMFLKVPLMIKIVWIPNSKGKFTVKSAYNLLLQESPSLSKLNWGKSEEELLCELSHSKIGTMEHSELPLL